uniref:(northern house mosquito) hypothetical protein n=1 Tax=Culex pipiens TaxID=7175 RepID=A0A8D8EVW7_CULPI
MSCNFNYIPHLFQSWDIYGRKFICCDFVRSSNNSLLFQLMSKYLRYFCFVPLPMLYFCNRRRAYCFHILLVKDRCFIYHSTLVVTRLVPSLQYSFQKKT